MLQGKVALVTGASRGIGRAIALELAQQGAKVIGTATGAAGVEAVRQALGARGAGKLLDLREAQQCDRVVAEVQQEFGDILILVNNAAVVRDNLALRMKDAEWDEVMETNLRAVFRLSRAVMRGMMKARARQPRHHRELRRARFHRHRHDARARRRAAQRAAGADSARAARARRGDRRGSGLSRIARRRLCHGQRIARQWRHVHGVIPVK